MDFPWIGIGFVWLRVQKSASRSGHSAGVEYLSRLNTLAGFFGQGIFGDNRHPIKWVSYQTLLRKVLGGKVRAADGGTKLISSRAKTAMKQGFGSDRLRIQRYFMDFRRSAAACRSLRLYPS